MMSPTRRGLPKSKFLVTIEIVFFMLRMLAHVFVTGAHLQLAETALFFMEKFMETFMEIRNARLLRVGTKKAQLL